MQDPFFMGELLENLWQTEGSVGKAL